MFNDAQQTEAPTIEYGIPRTKAYRPKRFAGAATGRWMDMAKPAVAEGTQFAASAIIDALKDVAAGIGHVPRRVRMKDRRRPLGFDAVYSSVGDGNRNLRPEDERRIRAAFRALYGVDPTSYWEVVLERALRDALAMRALLPDEPVEVTADGHAAVIRGAPTPKDVFDVVKKHALPGSLPRYLSVRTIEAAFEQCTDADRGGGRGNGAKWSVKAWIKWLKRKAAEKNSDGG